MSRIRRFQTHTLVEPRSRTAAATERSSQHLLRGSGQCVSMRLPYAELHLTVAYVFRRLAKEMQSHDAD
jgi:hypothetical protein